MSPLKKLVQISAATTFFILVSFLRKLNIEETSRERPSAGTYSGSIIDTSTRSQISGGASTARLESTWTPYPLKSQFQPGSPKPLASAYARAMVISRMKNEDISWIPDELPDLDVTVYVANEPTAPLHPPKNKGHEVMIYLSYIIDHYNKLPDVIIFMHAHRWTHHNNDLFGNDAVEMIRHLSSDHVTREGYVNMRCQWKPGCPEWLHPDNKGEALDKQEEEVLSRCWEELFPSEPVPRALGQACCAQFALSKERVISIPLSRFIFYRDWIMRTPLSDYVSGRIWEYSWQFLFTGRSIICPAEHICYCDGFGLCFGGAAEYKEFEQLRHAKQGYEKDLAEYRGRRAMLEKADQEHWNTNESRKDMDPATYSHLSDQVEALDREIAARRQKALERGRIPYNRAVECGRTSDEF